MSAARPPYGIALVLGSLALAGCPSAPPVASDAGLDAAPAEPDAPPTPLDAPGPPLDAGRDAPLPGRDGGPPDGGRRDAGPDLGPASCAFPLDFDGLATTDPDGARTLPIDLSARSDHRVTGCSPSAVGPDAVVRLSAPRSGRMVVETLGEADAILAVHRACDDGTELACNDDSALLSGPARVALEVTSGEVLFVVLDTLLPGAGAPIMLRTYVLPTRAGGEPCDPSGSLDACAAGTICAAVASGWACTPAAAVGCATPIDLDPLYDPTLRTALFRGTTVGASDLVASSCQTTAAPEMVHRFSMPFRGRVRADLRGRLVGLVAIETSCGVSTTELACEERGVVTAEMTGIHEAGAELFFVVEGWTGEVGTYELELSIDRIAPDGEPCALFGRAIDLCDPTLVCRLEGATRTCRPLVCGDGLLEASATERETCDPGPDAPGDGCGPACTYDDACATPIELGLVGTTTGDTVVYEGSTAGAGDDFRGDCSSTTLPGGFDRVLVYRPARNGILTLSTMDAATTFDTVLYARTDCAGPDLQCNDDIPRMGTRSRITVPVNGGQPLYIIVDGYRDTTFGTFRLTATLM